MELSRAEILKWESDYSTTPQASRGPRSVEFAWRVRKGDVSENSLIWLLNSKSDAVRSAISWAVFECMTPGKSLDFLCREGLLDANVLVRHYSIMALVRSKHIDDDEKTLRKTIEKALRDITEGNTTASWPPND